MGLTKRLWKKTKDVKRYDGSYYVEFRVIDDGKSLQLARQGGKLKRWRVGSLNKTLAKQQETLIKAELMKGQMKSTQLRDVTFKEWAEAYLDLEEVKRLRSYRTRVVIVQSKLIPFFGRLSLSAITPDHVEKYRFQRTKRNGTPCQLQTINNDHIILKHCLTVARRKSLLTINPATLVPIPCANNQRDRVLTSQEWEKLYEVAAPHLRPILITAYHMGQRLGELLNLTWDRVDLQRHMITLRSIDTKTGRPRQVPMTPAVRTVLTDLAKVRVLGHKFVFMYQQEPVKEIRTAFRTACQKAGVTDLRFHDLRHCAATNLRRAGIDTTTAMQIIGHKSAHMWNRYNTVAESDLLAAANKLNTYLSNTPITPTDSADQVKNVSA